MANTAWAFPTLTPSSRQYTPGYFPETQFEGLDGATTLIQYGSRRVNAKLSLGFTNLKDSDVKLIMEHYNRMTEDNWTTFSNTRGYGGVGEDLLPLLEDGYGSLRWRYTKPPEISSVYPGVSNVSCEFVGYFYAA